MRFLLILLILSGPVSAHSWYDHECCHDQDCHPIADCSEISEHDDGSVTWDGFQFTKSKVKASHDNKCHVCIYEGTGGGWGYQNKTPMGTAIAAK